MSDQTSEAQPEHQPGVHTHAQYHDPLYEKLAASEDFQELKKRYRAFVFPWTVAFLAWYLLYVVLSIWAKGFMSTQVLGNINLGLVLGLLQFVSTFFIAWLYSKHSAEKFDPLAEQIRTRFEKGDHA